MSEPLYKHRSHPHLFVNANALHKAEQDAAGFNQRLAVGITRATGTMVCAYVFALLALFGLFGILGWLSPLVVVLVTWVSQTFLQLVFLPVLSVGQATLSRKAEIQSDTQFRDVEAMLHHIEQIMLHLDAQDAKLLEQDKALLDILQRLDAWAASQGEKGAAK